MLLTLALVISAQAIVVDPPCGTVVDIDETAVEYTVDLVCPAEALDVQAANVDVDGLGNTITGSVLVSGDGFSMRDITLLGDTGTGLEVTGSSLVILVDVHLLGFTEGASFSNASDVLAIDMEVASTSTCLTLDNTGGDSEITTSVLRDCSVGVDASFSAGATMLLIENTLRSLGGATGIRLDGVSGFDPIEDNVVAGFAVGYELINTSGVILDTGSHCGSLQGGGVGVRLQDSDGTSVSGSLGGFDTAILVAGGNSGTALTVALSGNVVDVDDTAGSVGTTLIGGTGADEDADGSFDACDNCAFFANADQRDEDLDGLGDVCDPSDDRGGNPDDFDGDGEPNDVDNCPFLANPGQGDIDGDGAGDDCDPFSDIDHDDDGVVDAIDNCVFIANEEQEDEDTDGIGDACEFEGGEEGEGEGEVVGEPGGALVVVSGIPAFDEDCPDGGTRIQAGIDDDEDGVLDTIEVDSESVICNGAEGADGADGNDGAPGPAGEDGVDGKDGAAGLVDEDGDGVDDRVTIAGGNCNSAGGETTLAMVVGGLLMLLHRRRTLRAVAAGVRQ